MARKKPTSLAFRLRKTKAALLAVALTLAGIVLMAANSWLADLELGSWAWLHALPIGELGGTLFGAGFLGTLFEYSFRKDQEEATAERFRDIIKEQAPTMRDAVIEGFAIHPEDLKRVANPDMLDRLASNVMALRLGDEQFAREIYTDIRDQAIRAAERWHDVQVRIRISSALERSTEGTPLFDVTVEWEYTTIPSHAVRRFACVSDRDEFNELVAETPSTLTWFMRPRPGMDASKHECYELLSFTVDGNERTIRRYGRKTGQTYTVNIGEKVVSAGKPVRIRHVYRTVTSQAGHGLFVELPQPANGLKLRIDYTDTMIDELAVINPLSGVRRPPVEKMPAGAAGRVTLVDVAGWLLPRSGLTFTWTLAHGELPSAATTRARDEQRSASGTPG